MPNIGPLELIIVLVIILVIFGPKRLPGLGKQLGDGLRDFKDAVASKTDDDDDDEPTAAPPTLTAGETRPPAATPAAAETPETADVAKRTGLDA